MAEINAELHGQSIEPAGVVRLHVPSTYGRRCVSPLIPQLLAQHPRLRLDVTFDDDYVDLISARIDIALRIGSFDDSGLIGTGLRPIRRLLCASPRYLKGAPRLDHPENLHQPQVKLLWVAGADRSRGVRAVIDFLRRKLG